MTQPAITVEDGAVRIVVADVAYVDLAPEKARELASELLTAANQAEGHTTEEPT